MALKICITNRHLAGKNFLERIKEVLEYGIDILILREKDMSEREYESLAKEVIELCRSYGVVCMLHTFIEIASRINHPYIHLRFEDFLNLSTDEKNFFRKIGVSVHSVDEAVICDQKGASYITASHIFETSCKAGIIPRGLVYLKDTVNSVSIPVYALGGITPYNMDKCIENGAAGVCMMSYYMNGDLYQKYCRQMLVSNIGIKGQNKLNNARVLIIGAGGLGSPVIQYLAGAGIGTIGIVDGDKVGITNIHRQTIHTMNAVGLNKAISAKKFITALNPEVNVFTYPFYITDKNAEELISKYDFIIDCIDNFETEFILNDACVQLQKPFCYGGVIEGHGQVMTYVPKMGPCYRCIYEEPPLPGEIPTSEEVGILGPAAGVIGSIQAMEAVKYFTGAGELLTGKMMIIDLLSLSARIAKFPKANPRCKCCSCSDQ
jgi:thiamine-phosphate diphosphorylase